ncbi:MAG TPA: hypothetical protein VG412_08145 [Acidimicrobiales bacterium]|jgi:hypothetical protein|nr:hypothetical protein [Acidimicrobiales bacterium]
MSADPAHLQIDDHRDGDRHLRVSWHASRQVVVFSQWRAGVCVATTPVELADIPAVIGVLVDALEDASKAPPSPSQSQSQSSPPTAQSVLEDIQVLLRDWLRPRVASITALPPRSTSVTEEIERPVPHPPAPTLVPDPLPPTTPE